MSAEGPRTNTPQTPRDDSTYANGLGYVPIKPYLQKEGHSLWITTQGERAEDVARASRNLRGPGKQWRHIGEHGRRPWADDVAGLRVFTQKLCPPNPRIIRTSLCGGGTKDLSSFFLQGFIEHLLCARWCCWEYR